MRGFVDLHCHWIAAVDDGARTPEQGLEMLQRLHGAGFSDVVATPHMRPGMFEGDAASLRRAFDQMIKGLTTSPTGPLPRLHLASEHFFDDVVFTRLVHGQGLTYPGGGAALLEFPPEAFPHRVEMRLQDLRRRGITPVIAHPERYNPVWKDDACLDPLLDVGAQLLLDVCALVGKYGKQPQRAAEKLLEEEAYEAACSDAHRPEDVEVVAKAITRLEVLAGAEEAYRLLAEAPRAILEAPARAPS